MNNEGAANFSRKVFQFQNEKEISQSREQNVITVVALD